MSYYLSNVGGKYDELVSVDGNTVADKKELFSNYTSNTDEEYSIDSVCNNFGLDKEIRKDWTEVSTLPYNFGQGSAVIYNDEIHILGGNSNKTAHYKYNGSTWTEVSTLPYNFSLGSAVVYNNEIHIMGTNSTTFTGHYKWDGISWTEVSTLPGSTYDGACVVYNNEIHIMNGRSKYGASGHYKWDGISWTKASTLPYTTYGTRAVVYNNEIHMMGGYSSSYDNYHYKYDGISWEVARILPHSSHSPCTVVYNNEIHLIGGAPAGSGSTNSYYKSHYKLNKDTNIWESVSTLPQSLFDGSAVVYNNEIHILGTIIATKHYAMSIKKPNIFIEYKKEE